MFDVETTNERLKNLARSVKKFLGSKDIRVPFLIAGGSVFSTITDTSYDDVDVFFYNKIDLEILLGKLEFTKYSYETDNSLSVHHDNTKFQFIKCVVGDPEYILSTFDLNCSRCGVDSDYNVHYGEDFSRNILIDFNNFKGSTIQRYSKYVYRKRAKDKNKQELNKIVEFLCNNLYTEFDYGYINGRGTGLRILNNSMNKKDILHMSTREKIHNSIVDNYPEKERIDIFKELQLSGIEHGCDEYILTSLIHKYEYDFMNRYTPSSEERRVKLKYAEYFV
jgi:hypothetical protein